MKNIILLLLIASFPLRSLAREFTVIGMDAQGNETFGQIHEHDYQKLIHYELKQSGELLTHSVVMNPSFRNQLLLRTIMIGFGMNGNLAFGPYTIGANVNHQFYYDLVR